MIEKDEIICLKLLEKGPFFEEYLICIDSKKVKTPNFRLRAMKKPLLALNKTDEDIVMVELMIRSEIRHPFLNNQICAFQDYDNLYYVTEYAPVKLLDSENLPKRFSLEIVKFYTAEIFLCLKYLHSKKQNYTFVSHKNILLSADGHIKLDYAFCNCIENSSNGVLDNIEYLSPEYLEKNQFGYFTDYWSLGIAVYRMLYGFAPFTGKSVHQKIAEIKRCRPVFDDSVDEVTKEFIGLLLDPEMVLKYSTCEAIEKAIETHPFFAGIDWKMIEKKEYGAPFLIKMPEYDAKASPRLNTLYTSDFIIPGKDGYGNIFSSYNTVHYLMKRKKT